MMLLVINLMIDNYVSCRDRAFRATRFLVESAGDLKILCIFSRKWYLFRFRGGYGRERREINSAFAEAPIGAWTYNLV